MKRHHQTVVYLCKTHCSEVEMLATWPFSADRIIFIVSSDKLIAKLVLDTCKCVYLPGCHIFYDISSKDFMHIQLIVLVKNDIGEMVILIEFS